MPEKNKCSNVFLMKFRAVLIMVFVVLMVSLLLYAVDLNTKHAQPYALQDGDIVFQEGYHLQGMAIKAATNSRWTHVGIIFHQDGEPYVIEAVQPVKVTQLNHFVARNPSSFYAMRLKDAEAVLTLGNLTKAYDYCSEQLGKNYDSKFLWSDDRIYCSELVWKVYKKALNVELCKPRLFRSYDLEHPTVQKIIKQRYRSIEFLPLDEDVVAPSDIAESSLLVEVPSRINRVSE